MWVILYDMVVSWKSSLFFRQPFHLRPSEKQNRHTFADMPVYHFKNQ